MRLLLIFLIILNLLYAGWQYLKPVHDDGAIPPLADNLKTLELLHELRAVEDTLQAREAEVLTKTAEVAAETIAEVTEEQLVADIAIDSALNESANALRCYTLGPFKDQNIMQQVRESLSEHVSDVKVRKRQESEKHRYWVYIPAQSSREQAKALAKQLRASKIKDFYIVLSGDTKNGISLGHFREQSHANRRMKRVSEMGFEVGINVIYRDYDVYWLDYQLVSNQGSTEFTVGEYVSEGVSALSRECSER